VLSIVLGGCGGSAPTPLRKTAGTNVFTSKRYDYSVEVQAGWFTPDRFAEETKGEWDGVLYPLDPGVDTFADAQGQPRLSVAARDVKSGWALQRWTKQVAAGVPTPCGRAEKRGQRKVGGEMAMVLSYHCTDGYYVILATALHHGQGFAIGWASPEGSEKKDSAVFQRALESLTFPD
jgi:hypothetical protein